MRTALLSLAVVSLCLVAAPAVAQQTPLEAKEKSVIRFEVNVDKIINSELGKQLDLKDRIRNLPGINPEEIDFSAISRVFGSLSLPDNVAAFRSLGPGSDIPMDLFTRIEYSDAGALSSIFTKMSETTEEVEIDGKKFIKPSDASAPQGLLTHRVDEKTMETATKKYIMRADREVGTDGLSKAWGMAPDHAIRIVVDVDGMADLKEDLIDFVGESGVALDYVELLNNISNIRLTIDLDGDDLLTLSATGKDENLAEEFADGLDSIFFTAKFGLNPANAPNPEAGEVMQDISDALEAKVDGKEVNVVIPRPAGLGDFLLGIMGPGF